MIINKSLDNIIKLTFIMAVSLIFCYVNVFAFDIYEEIERNRVEIAERAKKQAELEQKEARERELEEERQEIERQRQEKLIRRQNELEKQQREIEKQKELERQQKELAKQIELAKQQKELNKLQKELGIKQQASQHPSLTLDFKAGASFMSESYLKNGNLENSGGAAPRFELNTIYFFNRYIGIGAGVEMIGGLSFDYKIYDYSTHSYSTHYAEDTVYMLYGIISGRIEKFTGYFVAGAKIVGLGIDYNIYNFLLGISYSKAVPYVSGWEFEYYSLNLSVGYRFNLMYRDN